MSERNSYFFLIISILLYVDLGYFTDRSDFIDLIVRFGILFGIYLALINSKFSVNRLVNISFLFKASLLFSVPALSDDFQRFLWDGNLMHGGTNPFNLLPSEAIKLNVDGINADAMNALNSPNYYTVYPPVSQLIFYLSTFSTAFPLVIMKLLLLASDIGVIHFGRKLLAKFNLADKKILWYALNPLVIIECFGNVHFEGVMMFGLIAAIWFITEQKWWIASAFFALAISTKLIPIILLPLLFGHLGPKRSFLFYLQTALLTALTFIPFISLTYLSGMLESVELYFKSFEFNASIYYLVRAIGFEIKGYNIIQVAGTALAAVPLIAILLLGFTNKSRDPKRFFTLALLGHTLYLLFSTTVHPWYIISLVCYSCFSTKRYAILWSLTAILSYAAYRYAVVEEQFELLLVEYLLVLALLAYESRHVFSKGSQPKNA